MGEFLNVVNGSFQVGVFPTALKTAIVKPLLKHNNLDAFVLTTDFHLIGLSGSVFNVLNHVLTIENVLYVWMNVHLKYMKLIVVFPRVQF